MNPLALGLLIGIAFGAALFLAGLSNPRLILEMLRLRDLRLLRVIVSALATGILGVALLDAGGLAHTSIKTLHLVALLLGGALFGAGFAVSGYCPGTSLAGAAEGRRDAPFVVLGGLLGTAAYALAYGWLQPLVVAPATFGKPTVPSLLGLPPLPVALVLGGALVALIASWRLRERGRRGHPTARERTVG